MREASIAKLSVRVGDANRGVKLLQYKSGIYLRCDIVRKTMQPEVLETPVIVLAAYVVSREWGLTVALCAIRCL
jgi:hypothetical protein